jgi:S1-C subfamily serine protease
MAERSDDERPDERPEEHLDDRVDDAPAGRSDPPHPLDRVWLHPSELPVDVGAARPRAPRRSPALVASAVAGAVGALVAVAVLALTGTLNRSTTPPASPGASPTTGTANSVAVANAATIGLSMVAVTARDGNGARRGSGVCVRHGTEVLTSARLIGDATDIHVFTPDGQVHGARVAGRDRTTDLALLALDATIPAAQLSSTAPAPGANVWIVGATQAGNDQPWMSSGVLSSDDAVVTDNAGPWTGGLFQTDAASDAAAVGAALVDQTGSVVGIVLGRLDESATSYAVPIKEALNVSDQLHATGVAKHGSLGFEGVDTARGPTITKVIKGAPAAAAGVRAGDIVVSVNGYGVATVDDVMALVRSNDPGTAVDLQLRRGSHSFRVKVRLAAVAG